MTQSMHLSQPTPEAGEWSETPADLPHVGLARLLIDNPGRWRTLTAAEIEPLAGPQLRFEKPPWMRLLFRLYETKFLTASCIKNRTWHEGDLATGSMMLMYENVLELEACPTCGHKFLQRGPVDAAGELS